MNDNKKYIELPLNITISRTQDDYFLGTLHSEVFKDIDFIGGKQKRISQTLMDCAIAVSKYEEVAEDEKMREFLSNPKNKQEIVKLAFKIGTITNWKPFDLDKLKKIKNKIYDKSIQSEEVIGILQNLIMFRNCRTMKSKGEEVLFTIVVKKEDMLVHIDQELATYGRIIDQLNMQKDALMTELDLYGKKETVGTDRSSSATTDGDSVSEGVGECI